MLEIRHLDIGSPLYISNPLEAKNHGIEEKALFLNNLNILYLHYSPFTMEIIRTPNLTELKILQSIDPIMIFFKAIFLKRTDWTLNEDVVFCKLKYLRIVEADLQRWETGNDNFLMLE
ncbi:hypothetical protein H5410_022022 [Solanum commersonii]|uniref:Late blight resistance protein n=1 Tax=Solanum commersonii TaxID=4109 RepID=A0A9J5ZE78_SOLCO|nr:hypothetical protein H5410_022022 [Solanum commersonii]